MNDLAANYLAITVSSSMYARIVELAEAGPVEGIGSLFGMTIRSSPFLPEAAAVLEGLDNIAILNLWTGQILVIKRPKL